MGLGSALLLYAAVALFGHEFSVPAAIERWASPLVGLVTGVITGATGIFVFPAVPYIQSLGLSKDDLVQALGLSFTVSTVALGAGLALHGAFAVQQLGLSLAAVLPALLGMWAGQRLRSRIPPKRFRQGFLLFLGVLGAQLIARPLFA